jgi:16S rRNA (cytosine1402-N4)-methyltransferase
VFQALRIHVNQELGELTTLVHDALDLLKPKGLLAIISFHSLEDRIIKHEFQKLAGRRREKDLPKELAAIINQQNQSTRAEIIKPFPTLPSEEEVKENYRSRSAKLRILEKTL